MKLCFDSTAGVSDYEELSPIFGDILLSFDDDNRRLMFPVKINDDYLYESVEEPNLELKFNPFGDMTAPSGVMLSPNVIKCQNSG